MFIGPKALYGNKRPPLGRGKKDGVPRWWLPLSHLELGISVCEFLQLRKYECTLSGFIETPELFDVYPHLETIPFELKVNEIFPEEVIHHIEGKTLLDPTKPNTIEKIQMFVPVNKSVLNTMRHKIRSDIINPISRACIIVAIHEIQHAIQVCEGMEFGSSQSHEKQLLIAHYLNRLDEKSNDCYSNPKIIDRQRELLQACSDDEVVSRMKERFGPHNRVVRLAGRFDTLAMRNYLGCGGEIEARIAEGRRCRTDHLIPIS